MFCHALCKRKDRKYMSKGMGVQDWTSDAPESFKESYKMFFN